MQNLAEKENVVNITQLRPMKRASKAAKEHPVLNIDPKIVDRYISYQQQLKEMETIFKGLQEEIHEQFSTAMEAAERRGEHYQTMTAAGSLGELTITSKNQYSRIDASETEHLHRALGSTFDTLIDETQDVKLKGDWGDFIDAAFAAGWHDAVDWFDVRNFLTIRKDGLATRARLRRELGRWAMKIVDDLFNQTQYKPSIRAKIGGTK